jgi:hypothetical protein
MNNTLTHEQWVFEKIGKKSKSSWNFNENESTLYQNLGDTANAVLRGKIIAMNTYIKNTERSQINDQMLHLKLLEKQEQVIPKTSRRREIIKNKSKNKQKRDKNIQRINKTKSYFTEKINKIDTPLANMTKMEGKDPN